MNQEAPFEEQKENIKTANRQVKDRQKDKKTITVNEQSQNVPLGRLEVIENRMKET